VSILLALPYAVHMRIAQGCIPLVYFSNSFFKVQWPCHFSLCVEDWVDLEDLRSVYGVITAILQVAFLKQKFEKNFFKSLFFHLPLLEEVTVLFGGLLNLDVPNF